LAREGQPFDPTFVNRIRLLINSINIGDVGGESTADVVVSRASRLLIHPNYNRDTFVSISNVDNATLDSYRD